MIELFCQSISRCVAAPAFGEAFAVALLFLPELTEMNVVVTRLAFGGNIYKCIRFFDCRLVIVDVAASTGGFHVSAFKRKFSAVVIKRNPVPTGH